MNNFELASRQKLRFDTSKGLLSIEDIWDLPLTSHTGKVCLDGIAIELYKQLSSTADVVSFVDESAKKDPVIQLQFDIVKHVIDQRKIENAEVLNAKAKAETKQQILAALSKKREGAIEAMSEEDLLKKLSEL